MEIYASKFPKEALQLFSSSIGSGEYFSYVGNVVSLEKSLAVMGLLYPDFIEREGCVFWRDNAADYIPSKYPMVGMKRDQNGKLTNSTDRADIERYRNNFAVSQFFAVWEDSPGKSVFRVGLSEDDYQLCHLFAQQIERYWRIALSENFPNRSFKFEIGDDLLDEYGVCVTFWQTDHSAAGSSGV